MAFPANVHVAGRGLGSRWHVLLQALEWTVLSASRVVLSDRNEPGIPYLAREGCSRMSERCFLQDLDTCDSFEQCSRTAVPAGGTATWR